MMTNQKAQKRPRANTRKVPKAKVVNIYADAFELLYNEALRRGESLTRTLSAIVREWHEGRQTK